MKSLARRARIASALALSAYLLTSRAAGPPEPSSPVYGIVTELDAPALDRVESFSLQLDSGEEMTFRVEPGDRDVTAADLREHRNFAVRMRVFFTRTDSGELLAERVEHFGTE